MKLKTDKNNSIVINEYGKERIVLDGKWALTEDYSLKFHVLADSDSYLKGKTIIFKGTIEKIKKDALIFRIRQYENVDGIHSGTISLTGRWQADKNNRITFEVSKRGSSYDVLIFQGQWSIGDNHKLVYRYEEKDLSRGKKITRVMTFNGKWKMGYGDLIYDVEGSSSSFFRFKAAIKIKKILSSAKKLSFEAGIKYLKKNVYRKVRKNITFYGTWELTKDLKVGFTLGRSNLSKQKIDFLIEKIFKKNTTVVVSLKDVTSRSLGVKVEFTKVFNDDAHFFLSLSRTKLESKILGGVTVKF